MRNNKYLTIIILFIKQKNFIKIMKRINFKLAPFIQKRKNILKNI